MIVPMKKVSLLVMDKEKDTSLEKLRDLGIMHLEKKAVASADLTKLMNRRTQLEIASGILAAFTPKKGQQTEHILFTGDLASHVIALFDRRKKLQDYIFNHQRERENFERWGEFNPKDFKYINENGVPMYLYHISQNSYEKNVGDVPVIKLKENKKHKTVRLVAFGEIPNETPRPLPDRPISEVNERDQIRQEERGRIEAELFSLSHLRKQIDDERKAILGDIEFATAHASMELIDEDLAKEAAENPNAPDMAISWISGYIPAPDLGLLKRAASESGWAFCADDPDKDDTTVPTKLKNNRFVNLLNPLLSFLDLTPGYRETDISGIFLMFFTVFFAMLFGDAGYGTLLLLISVLLMFKTAKNGVPVFFKFLLLMSISTIVWGSLTCAWFGFDFTKVPTFLHNISLPLLTAGPTNPDAVPGWLEAYYATNYWIQFGLVQPYSDPVPVADWVTSHLMVICFTIALAHLGIARLKSMFIKLPSLRAFGELGSLGMLFGMYFVVLALLVDKTGFAGVQMWQLYFIGGGFALVFLFGRYEGNFIKGVISSCANIISVVLGITSVFSDIMSYIRLWAVGVAGASLAATIDGGAMGMLANTTTIALALVLFVGGHAFNIALCAMAVLVHAVRLNTLEFSSNLGLGWTGFVYKPFAKR